MTLRRVGASASAAAMIAVLVGACSGEDAPQEAPLQPSPTSTPTSAPTQAAPPVTQAPPVVTSESPEVTEEPTETEPPEPEPIEPPTSADDYADRGGVEFDADPRIEVVQRYAIEYALAVNDGNPERPELMALLTENGQSQQPDIMANDLEAGVYPGPLPVEFVEFDTHEGWDVYSGCVVSRGAMVDESGESIDDLVVIEALFYLEGGGDAYVIHHVSQGERDCDDVEVQLWN